MKLLPDVTTAYVDPFRTEKTLEHQHVDRRPVHRRALQPRPAPDRGEGRGVPEVDGHRRHRVLRLPRPSSTSSTTSGSSPARRRASTTSTPSRAPGTPAARRRAATSATRPPTRAATSRSRRSTTSPTCATRSSLELEKVGLRRRAGPPRGRHRGPGGDQLPVRHAAPSRRQADALQVHHQGRRRTATAAPRRSCRSRSSATTARACTCHQSLWKDGAPLFYDEKGYGGLSDIARWYIGGLLKHAPVAARLHQPDGELATTAWCRASRPRSTWSTRPRNRSACIRIPVTGSNPKAKRIEFRVPDPSSNPYLAFSAMLMAGLDGIKNKIEPPEPVDKDLYELPPEEHASIAAGARLARRGARQPGGRPRVPAPRAACSRPT